MVSFRISTKYQTFEMHLFAVLFSVQSKIMIQNACSLSSPELKAHGEYL